MHFICWCQHLLHWKSVRSYWCVERPAAASFFARGSNSYLVSKMFNFAPVPNTYKICGHVRVHQKVSECFFCLSRGIFDTPKNKDIFMRLTLALCWPTWVWLFHKWLPLQPVASWACLLSTSCGQGSLCQAASFRRHYSTMTRQPSAQFGVYVKKVMFLDFF